MPILSYMLERMGYTTSCVGINLGDPPRLIPPHSVVYPHTSLASLKYCYIAGGVGGADTVDRADIKAPDESPVLPEPKG